MINWLNKQLNEQMLGSHGKYTSIDAAAATVNSLTNSNTSRIPSRLALVNFKDLLICHILRGSLNFFMELD